MSPLYPDLTGAYVATAENGLLTTGQEVYHRRYINSNAVLTGDQVLRLTYFTSRKSETVTQVRTGLGGVAAGATPTLCRIGLYTVAANGDIALVASTANDTALYGGVVGTRYTKSFSVGYALVQGQRYGVGILVVTGATAPTLMGQLLYVATEFGGEAPTLGGSVAAQADLPASVVSASINANPTSMAYSALLP